MFPVWEKSPAVVVEPSASESTGGSLVPGEEVSQDEELDSQTDARFVMAEDHQVVDISEDNIKFVQEQHDCPTLKSFWSLGRDQRKNFIIDHGLLYHRENQWGHPVKQLCLPRSRVLAVLQMGHDAPDTWLPKVPDSGYGSVSGFSIWISKSKHIANFAQCAN